MLQRAAVPWSLLGLPADFELEHLELRLLQPTGMYPEDGGIVSNEQLLDPRTGKGVRGGLFDERIFGTLERQGNNIWGPRRDLKLEHRGLPRRNELSFPTPRRDRFGRVELGCPMLHPAFLAKDPSWLEQRTGLRLDDLRRLDTHDASIVLESDGDPAAGTVIATNEDQQVDPSVTLATGAEAVRTLLRRSGESLDPVIERVWVVPVQLRPLVPARWLRYWLADLNELYERLIRRNNVMLELIEINAGDYLRTRQREILMHTLELLYCNRSCEAAAVNGAGGLLDGLLDVAGGDALGQRLRSIDAATPNAAGEDVMPWNDVLTRRCLQAMGLVLRRKQVD